MAGRGSSGSCGFVWAEVPSRLRRNRSWCSWERERRHLSSRAGKKVEARRSGNGGRFKESRESLKRIALFNAIPSAIESNRGWEETKREQDAVTGRSKDSVRVMLARHRIRSSVRNSYAFARNLSTARQRLFLFLLLYFKNRSYRDRYPNSKN